MIKFKRILEKAAGQAGRAQPAAPVAVAEPPAAEAVAVLPLPDAVAVEIEIPDAVIPGAHSDDFSDVSIESLLGVEEAPAAVEPAPPEPAEPEVTEKPPAPPRASQPPPGGRFAIARRQGGPAREQQQEPPQPPPAETETAEEAMVSDRLIASVLGEMFPDAASAGAPAGGAVADATVDLAAVLGQPALEGAPPERAGVPPAAAPEPQSPADAESTIEGMVNEAFAAIADEGRQAAAESAEPGASAEPQPPDAEPGGQPIDDSFMAEIDRLLSEFGQVSGPEEEAPAAARSPKAVLDDVSPGAAEPAAESPEASEAATEASAASAPAGESIQAESPEEDSASVLTQAEKDALFSEDATSESVSAGDVAEAVEQDLQDLSASPEGQGPAAPGAEAEVELDFSAGALGIEDDAASDPAVEAEDLLSKVLADLDKIGQVEKPAKEPSADEAEQEAGGVEDFSEILSELNAESAQGAGTATAKGAADPKAVEISASSITEEELLNEAIRAADEAPVASPQEGEDEPGASAPGGKNKKAKGKAKEDKNAGKKPSAKSDKDSRQDDGKETRGKHPSEDDQDEDDGVSDGEDATAAGKEPGDKPEEAPVEEEDALLANLEASMETAAKKAEEEAAKAGADKPKAERESEEEEEEVVRKQVLSRSKDVEQKVLDDVFGERSKDYRGELKAEMASLNTGKRETGEKASALAAESARHAGARDAAAPPEGPAAVNCEMPPGLGWLAYQINRPFLRWLSPSTLRLLGALSLALLGAALIWLVAALAKLWFSL